jgi:hypothetical protein
MISTAEPAFNAMASAAGNEVKSNANWSKGIECITCLDVSYEGENSPGSTVTGTGYNPNTATSIAR